MNVWSQVKNWLANLRGVNGIPLPNDGRSSVDDSLNGRISSFLTNYAELAPGLSFETLAALKSLYIFNPDFSQAVSNFVALANTGHKIVIDASSARRAEIAVNQLDALGKRIYPNSHGVNGLIRDQLVQACWSGVLSREDVIDITGRTIKRVLLVPPEEIRFQAIEQEWQPHQMPRNGLGLSRAANGLGLIPLHPTTYRYYALEHIDNSPYGKPPFTAALKAILETQDPMLASLRQAAEKLGFLGLYSVEVAPPNWDRSKETFEEFQARGQKVLRSVRDAFESAAKSGKLKNFIATFRDQKVQVTPTTGDATGAKELFNLNEEQVGSALHTMPLFLGRTFSVTEALAGVLYYVYTAHASDFQQIVASSLERTYGLELALNGAPVNGVHVEFNPIRSHNEIQQAQAEEIRQRIIFNDAQHGLIDANEAAQQRGYAKAFDATILNPDTTADAGAALSGGFGQRASEFRAEFRYDPVGRAYRFTPPRIEAGTTGLAGSDTGNLIDFGLGKKKVRRLKRTC